VSGLSRLEIPVSGRCNECGIALVIPEEIAIKVSALHHRLRALAVVSNWNSGALWARNNGADDIIWVIFIDTNMKL
jgi:hypothetical protein